MTTVMAPPTMTRREMVADIAEAIPAGTARARLGFVEGEQFATVSFVDELIRQVLFENRAEILELIDPQEFTAELATMAAERYSVLDRLVLS